ncbi:MAG TPA: NAD(P)/FAD-dependent oxidoreductase, partial [Rhizomicrobium sp.]|nr:NAD(P)/FAD-dependent oxidoreductase [Rhizomicrobium sp.]
VQYVEKTSEGFTLQLSSGEVLSCGALVVATGGKSIPKMGATDFGYRDFTAEGTWPDRFIHWARDLGFFNKPGVETLAAQDVADFVSHPAAP